MIKGARFIEKDEGRENVGGRGVLRVTRKNFTYLWESPECLGVRAGGFQEGNPGGKITSGCGRLVRRVVGKSVRSLQFSGTFFQGRGQINFLGRAKAGAGLLQKKNMKRQEKREKRNCAVARRIEIRGRKLLNCRGIFNSKPKKLRGLIRKVLRGETQTNRLNCRFG